MGLSWGFVDLMELDEVGGAELTSFKIVEALREDIFSLLAWSLKQRALGEGGAAVKLETKTRLCPRY